MRVIDLSMSIADGMPVYPGDPEVKVKVAHTYESHNWELRRLSMGTIPEHMWTRLRTSADTDGLIPWHV
ncbi:cyclase family protein [Paenibacillus oceani]|uniref:hypothetical protein n=1 Tax=Paenibacillus oceani TaxID=2772510 RepID=UPI001CC24FA7|nr:hypothetical protein [Paenibacillus oceani]